MATASAIWYATWAPSRGRQVEPGAATEVALTATQTGAGSWVRYLLTVRNVGESDFTGNVLLIDRDQADDAVAATPQLPATTRPAAQLPTGRQVAPETAYQVRVSVAAGRERTITVVAPDSFNTALVTDAAGGALTEPIQVDRAAAVPVAVLSDVETAATQLAGLTFDRYGTRVASFQQARAFPATPLLLGSFAAVVIDQFDTAALSHQQLQALRDYVGLGGSLVLAGGAGWRRTLAPLPAELLPLRPTATATASLAPVGRLAGTRLPEASLPAATGSLAQGARAVLAAPDGTPLLVEAAYGAGHVIELAYDPAAEALPAPLVSAVWSQAVGRAFSTLPGGQPSVSVLPGPETNFSQYFGPPGDAPLPSPFLVGPLLAGYVLLIAPFNYWLLRRRGWPTLLWLTAPLGAAVVTGLFYVAGQALQGSLQDHSVQVLRLAPGGSAAQIQYDRILFLHRGDHFVQPEAGALVAPLTLNTYRTTGSTCDRCTVQLSGLQAGSEHVLPGPQPVVQEQGVVYGSVRVLAATRGARPGIALVPHLRIAGGRVVGSIANVGSKEVRRLWLFSFDGQLFHSALLAGSIPPGGLVEVDAAAEPEGAGPPPGAPGQGREGSNLARVLATIALERDAAPMIVGFTDPLPTALMVDGGRPPSSTVTAFEMPFVPESADSLIASFSSKRLASESGSQRDGFTDVYDIALPPGPAAGLAFSYDNRWAQQAEIYDWATGAWRTVTQARDDINPTVTTPLTEGEAQSRLVRVRVREPRLSWGSTLAVERTKPSG